MRVSKKLPEIQHVIDMLEWNGFECENYHDLDFYTDEDCDPIQGVSIFTITDSVKDENECYSQFQGVAYCSVYDQFDKSVGTAIAFKRAYQQFCGVYSRQQRLSFFDSYGELIV